MIGALRQRAMVGSELWRLSQDERNAAVYAENHSRALDDALDEAQRVYIALCAEIAQLSDAEMDDPALIANMPGVLTPWQLLADIWRHYDAHLPALQALADADAAD